MRVALISDVHGNRVALDAVLNALQGEDHDQLICLGDVAAMGPEPRACIERLAALEIPVVMGNADAWLLDPASAGLPEKPSAVLHWGADQLGADERAFLESFRPTVEQPLSGNASLCCFHGSPRSYHDVISAETPEGDLDALLGERRATVMASGHTHVPMLRRHRGALVLNPGSVGLACLQVPQLGHPTRYLPWAEYALLAWRAGALDVALRRLPLDLDAVRRAARGGGMPHADWWCGFWEPAG